MTKATTKLSAQDHVILFCVATGTDHCSVAYSATHSIRLPDQVTRYTLNGFGSGMSLCRTGLRRFGLITQFALWASSNATDTSRARWKVAGGAPHHENLRPSRAVSLSYVR